MLMSRGLSAVSFWPAPTGSNPPACEYLPFASWFAPCKPATPDQVLANDMSNLGGSVDPAIVAQLQQQWAQTDAQQCASHPEECAAYQFATSNPTLSAALGTGTPAQTVANIGTFLGSGLPSFSLPEIPWLLIGVVAAFGLWMVRR